jgi:hypothetical protein
MFSQLNILILLDGEVERSMKVEENRKIFVVKCVEECADNPAI